MSKNQLKDNESQTFDHELAGKYLTFQLKNETYGCPIRPINDIIEMKEITEVPQTSDHVKGVINLRGSVIPVISLRKKFGMDEAQYDRQTCIIVVELDDLQTGLIVDQVEEVIEVADDQLDPAQGLGSDINQKFIAGMGKLPETVLILLDLQNILKEEEKEELQDVQQRQQT